MLEYLNNVFSLGNNGCFSGNGGLSFVTKKVKFFDFSCMLEAYCTVIALLKYVVQLLMVKIIFKVIKQVLYFAILNIVRKRFGATCMIYLPLTCQYRMLYK